MKLVHFPSLPEDELHSPARHFHSFCRNVSLALGGIRNAGTWGGGHPFDFQIRRIPPGAAVCPFHSHLAQWELFVVRFYYPDSNRWGLNPARKFFRAVETPYWEDEA